MSAEQRVLIVDDSPTQAKQLELLLHAAGFAIETVPDGEAALEALERESFHVVLSDVLMPGMDGYELCRMIKESPRYGHVPVILLTNLKEADDIMKGLAAGADNFITKPYEVDSLVERIRTVFSNHGGREQNGEQSGDLDFRFMGKKYGLRASRQQILSFLLATFEDYAYAKQKEKDAMRRDMERQITTAELLLQKNRELLKMNSRLEHANSSLVELHKELKNAHERLENTYDDIKRKQAIRELDRRRMAMELATARTVQRMLIPRKPPQDIPGFEFAFSYRPADEAAGDWLGFFHNETARELSVLIGDVTDHGVAAALVTAATASCVYTACDLSQRISDNVREVRPVSLLNSLNKIVGNMAESRLYMTFLATALDYDERVLHIATAGHPAPLIIRPSQLDDSRNTNVWQGIHTVSRPSPQLGQIAAPNFPSFSLPVERGDIILWFTDGVLLDDVTAPRHFLTWLREVRNQPVGRIQGHLDRRIRAYLGDRRPKDDIAFILARSL